VQKLKLLLQHVRIDDKDINGLAGPHIIIEGANVHIQSGTGTSGDGSGPIGLGNLIIGYNGVVPSTTPARTGSHNLVIGAQHTYTSHGGLVAGQQNTISGPYASVSGGRQNFASGEGTSISGGKYAEINELAPEGTWHGGGVWSNGQVTSLRVLEILGQ